jgi:two-component system chemotaxis sensor kinase CheA
MSKYRPLFLSETGEHLDALENDLVALERAPGEQERIHEVFRHLHSIKSMAASMEHDRLAALAHRLEDLVAPHREDGAPFSALEIDLLLRGLDALRASLAAISSGQPEPEPPGPLLAGLQAASAPSRPRATRPPPPASPPAEDPTTWRLTVQLDPGCSLPGARATVLCRRLAGLGQVLSCEPPLEALAEGLAPGRPLVLELRSARPAEEIRALVDGVPELATTHLEPARAAPEGEPDGRAATGFVRVRTELLDGLVDSVAELLAMRSHLEELAERRDDPSLQEGVRQLSSLARRLQDRVFQARMVPAGLLTGRLPRVCRDLARARGLELELELSGEEVELDRGLVEALHSPLLHLVRNAVDHGLEPPEERLAHGKPAAGRLRLTFERRQDRVQVSLEDDGRGIDLARVRARAEALGLLSPGTPLDDARLRELVFQPGFSTRGEVSATSGRGVGLDAVRDSLRRLGGWVALESRPGLGTRFILDLPLTLAILHVLLVEAGPHQLALPASRVLRAVSLRPSAKTEVAVGSRRLPLASLLALLGEADQAGQEPREALLVGQAEGAARLALGVARVAGHREAVLRPVGRLLGRLGPYAGSTVLGDGRPVLILDVDALLERAARAR